VVESWKRLSNEELHDVYASPNIIRAIKWRTMRLPGHVARMGEMINTYKIVGAKPEGKRLLGRHRRRREDNIRMDLREIVCEGVDWMYLTQDKDQWRALVKTVMNLWVP